MAPPTSWRSGRSDSGPPPGCVACSEEWPPADHRIADLDLTRVSLHGDQFFPGWTLLVLRRHATELFELTAAERGQLIEEVSGVAAALAAVFQALKVNYGLLGNLLPHIHWHVIPRLAGDPAPREAPWGVSHAPATLAGAALRERIAQIRARLTP